MVFVSWNLYWWEDRANKKNINCTECWPSVAVIKRRQPGRRKHTCKGPEEGNCQTKKRLTAKPALSLNHSSPPTTRLLGGAAAGVQSAWSCISLPTLNRQSLPGFQHKNHTKIHICTTSTQCNLDSPEASPIENIKKWTGSLYSPP